MIKILTIFLLLTFICGCENNPFNQEKYQMVEGKDGKIYRLNKLTGEMIAIKDNKIIVLETPEARRVQNVQNSRLEEPIEWGESRISGKKLKVKLRTCWRDGKLYYNFKAFPYRSLRAMYYKEKNETYYGQKWFGFTIKLLDTNNFVLSSISIKMWDMTRLVNEEGIETGLSSDSNISFSRKEYESIASYSIGWTLDDDIIPDYTINDMMEEMMQLYPDKYGKVYPSENVTKAIDGNFWYMPEIDGPKYYFSTQTELDELWKAQFNIFQQFQPD